ncbi:TetR family transcriptional regulator [Rhodococcus hoagii]|nr:TetR family transcriptional regulator [Prescottella equi]NKS73768.1 TetR family transcriptional regulator [Prescottella equi]NKZ89331.1 TetR family transcriptional regulator [Prescottella equi]
MENAAPSGNRRGRRSRQEILDVAARVMSARGYAGTSMSVLVKETGLPRSAFYHHFESKAGLLSEVMARGARAFFDAMRAAHRNPPVGGAPRERLGWYLQKTGEVFVDHEDFMRLMLVLVMSNEAAEAAEAMQTVVDVRTEGRELMRDMIHSAFAAEGDDVAAAIANELSHFGMAGFDGAFVSSQTNDGKPMGEFMSQLTEAIASIGEARARSMQVRDAEVAR